MKTLRNRKLFKDKKTLAAVAGLWVILFAYTNCAGQKFTFSPTEPFNPVDMGDIDCKQVTELDLPTDGSALHIPPRDNKDTCYTLKIVTAKSYSPSSSNPNKDDDILSSNHDAGDQRQNSHPYKLGDKIVNLFLEGPRSIKLAGSADGNAEIKVDNFILVGIAPMAQIYDPQFYKAYGTDDCKIHNVSGNPIGTTAPYNNPDGISYVSFMTKPVVLTPFAAGGTASVTPFRVDGDMQTNRSYSIDFRALDCGGIAVTSDIYLSFE